MDPPAMIHRGRTGRPAGPWARRAWRTVLAGLLALLCIRAVPPPARGADAPGPFDGFTLPAGWEAKFWAGPDAAALFKMAPKDVAALVPVQAGVKHCRCPACDADEADDPLGWSLEKPKQLTCRACGAVVPNDKYPAPDPNDKDKKVPEDVVEVRPGVAHHYPYHLVEPLHQRYPDEHLYLSAKVDHEKREFLCKAALYAALKYRDQPAGRKDRALALTACVILLRSAQVYPSYATHYDQPVSVKLFDKADLPPPYRPGYRTARWDWSGALEVPLNLVVAHALLRNDPAMAEAGKLLKEADPVHRIERDLFRAAAVFLRNQSETFSETGLQADRGILAVGRLLDDPEIVRDALARLDRLSRRGFYHDGLWREGTLVAHRRVVNQLDGWIARMLVGYQSSALASAALPGADGPGPFGSGGGVEVPMLSLAREAGSAVLADLPASDLVRASWPEPQAGPGRRGPVLLGGAGLARLAVGQGADALDVELRSLDVFGPERIVRQALRLAVAGRNVIDDLDERRGLASGFERSSVAHNTVVVDGLNQRESLRQAHEPAAGGNFLFFAADPDFQVVTLDDPRAYPTSTRRYRQTLIASAGARSRYVLGVFEVVGGLQHDQVVNGPVGSDARWRLGVPTGPGPRTLLPVGLTHVPTARADDGRWFIQSYGDLVPLARGAIERPTTAWCVDPSPTGAAAPGVRLHILGDTPLLALTAVGPDPTRSDGHARAEDGGRGVLVLRRGTTEGATLQSTFVTLYEPVAPGVAPLRRVGRATSPAGTVVVYVEGDDGAEYLVVNLNAGRAVQVALPDNRVLTTDGLAVRASARELVLAGGTFAELAGRRVEQARAAGQLRRTARVSGQGARGWFEVEQPLPRPEALVGRVVLVRHGDGTTRGWTVRRVENQPDGARLFVHEEPGFEVDPATRTARYYQFPHATAPGPHELRVGLITRSAAPDSARAATPTTQ